MSRTYSTARDRLAQRAKASPAAEQRPVVDGPQPVNAVLDQVNSPSWRQTIQPVTAEATAHRTTVNVHEFMSSLDRDVTAAVSGPQAPRPN